MESKLGWNGVLRLALSARVTAAIFIAFLLLFVVGFVVPQAPLADPAQIDAFAERFPSLARVAEAVGCDDVYHSPWMYGVFALFVLQLLVYLGRRSVALWSDPQLTSGTSPEDLPAHREIDGGDRDLDDLAELLAARRYHVVERAGRLVAVKHRWSPLWGIVFHASFIVILLGAWILRVSDLHGDMLVTEGQIFRGLPHEFRWLEPPGLAGDDLPRVGFAVDSIDPVFGDGGYTSDIVVHLRREDGSVGELRVNQPLEFDGVDVLIRNFGVAPVFSVWDLRGDEPRFVDGFSPRLICWSPGLPTDSFRLLHPEAAVEARFLPDFVDGPDGPVSASMNQRDPVLVLRVHLDDAEEAGPGESLRIGEALRIGDFELRLDELRTWGEFLVSRQAGSVLLFGFALMVVGAALRLLFPRREIVAEIRAVGPETRISIGGRGEFFPVGFRWEFDDVVASLSSSREGSGAGGGDENGTD